MQKKTFQKGFGKRFDRKGPVSKPLFLRKLHAVFKGETPDNIAFL